LGLKVNQTLEICNLTHHQYYYKSVNGKPGVKATTTTPKFEDGSFIEVKNEVVLAEIKRRQSNQDLKCGYRRMTYALQLLGYNINHKKVYRLMDTHDLLRPKICKTSKNYARYRIVSPLCPLSHLEMDIKFVWVESYRTRALVLSVIDIFTRRILDWHVGMSITQHTVKEVFTRVVENHLQANDMLSKGIDIEIRNDNDKRFSAKLVQDFFAKNYLNQVFTHPYTPEENGHIESFHKTLSEALSNDHMHTLEQLETRLGIFYDNYNNHRTHGSICGLTPHLFNEQWEKGNIKRIVLKNKKVKFNLLIPRYELSGNMHWKEVSCSSSLPLEGALKKSKTKKDGATTKQLSVQKTLSVASC